MSMIPLTRSFGMVYRRTRHLSSTFLLMPKAATSLDVQ